MKFCTKCGKEIMDEAVVCPNCGCAVDTKKLETLYESEEDKISVGFCVLSVLIPLFGIIYWPVNHKKTPKRAMVCGISALISWAVYFAILLSLA